MRRNRFVSEIVCLLVCGAPGAAQETRTRLQARHAAGERFTLHRAEQTEGRARITIEGEEKPQEHPVSSLQESLTQNRVLEVDDGKVRALERKFDKHRSETRAAGVERPEKVKSPLEGKTVVLRRDGDRTAVERAEKIPAEELAGLALDPDPFLLSLPADEIPVGHKWEIPQETLVTFFSRGEPGVTYTKAKAECRFEKIEPRSGADCAVVRVSLEVEGKGKNEFTVVTRLKGTLWIAVAERRYTGLELEGTFETSASDPKEKARVRTSGKIQIKETLAYVRG